MYFNILRNQFCEKNKFCETETKVFYSRVIHVDGRARCRGEPVRPPCPSDPAVRAATSRKPGKHTHAYQAIRFLTPFPPLPVQKLNRLATVDKPGDRTSQIYK